MLEVQCDMAISKSEASAMSEVQVAVLEQATPIQLGNPRLRRMSEFAVRRALAKQWASRPDLRGRWSEWANDWSDKEKTYRAAGFRGFERGEKGGRIG